LPLPDSNYRFLHSKVLIHLSFPR